MTIRVVCNLLQTGPRQNLTGDPTFRFSLQVAAGYDSDSGDREKLLPWNLLPLDGKVEIRIGWLVRDNNTGDIEIKVKNITVNLPSPPDPIAGLRQTFQDSAPYQEADLSWQTPTESQGTITDDPDEFQVVTRQRAVDLVLYLSTLPPSVSEPLGVSYFLETNLTDLVRPLVVAAPSIPYQGTLVRPKIEDLRDELFAMHVDTGFPPNPRPLKIAYDNPDLEAHVLPEDLTIPNTTMGLNLETYWFEGISRKNVSLRELDSSVASAARIETLIRNLDWDTLLKVVSTPKKRRQFVEKMSVSATFIDFNPLPEQTSRKYRLEQIKALAQHFSTDETLLLNALEYFFNQDWSFSIWRNLLQRALSQGTDVAGSTLIQALNRDDNGTAKVYHTLWKDVLDVYAAKEGLPNSEREQARNLRGALSRQSDDDLTQIYSQEGVGFRQQNLLARNRRVFRTSASEPGSHKVKIHRAIGKVLREDLLWLLREEDLWFWKDDGDLKDIRDQLPTLLDLDYLIANYLKTFQGLDDTAPVSETLPNGLAIQYAEPNISTRDQFQFSETERLIAGTGLMLTRGNDATWEVDERGNPIWRLANVGIAVDGNGQRLHTEPSAIPLRIAYCDDMARTEIVYESALLGVDDPRASATPQIETLDILLQREIFGYHPSGLDMAVLKPPPLRFGDKYKAAVFAIGSSGGLPRELTGPNSAHRLDPSFIQANSINPPSTSEITFKRKVPVADVDLIPLEQHKWKTHDGVSLLGSELWEICMVGEDERPAPPAYHLLLAEKDHREVPSRFKLGFHPPQVADQVLMPWHMPNWSDSQPDKDAFKKKLAEVMSLLLADRESLEEGEKEVKLDIRTIDPAVSAVGLRLFAFQHADNERGWEFEKIGQDHMELSAEDMENWLRRHDDPYILEIEQVVGPPSVRKSDQGFTIKISKHTAWFIEIHALMTESAQQRMDDNTWKILQAGHRSEDRDSKWPGTDYFFLPGEAITLEILVENAMPTAQQIHEIIKLEARGRSVALSLDLPQRNLDNRLVSFDQVGAFQVGREHWTWQGRPLGGRDASDPEQPWITDPWGRPPEVLFPDACSTSTEDPATLEKWEQVVSQEAMATHLFAERVWRFDAWNKGGEVQVWTDPRDDREGGDYHRYSLRLKSRYAPLLPKEQAVIDTQELADGYRRIYLPYQGPRLPAPVVLAILPLTTSMVNGPDGPPPRENLRGAAPVLVICDHVPHDATVMDERLVAMLRPDLVDGETATGDEDGAESDHATDHIPFRVGPVGDVYPREAIGDSSRDGLSQTNYWGNGFDRPRQLEVWGPFALSFEVSEDDARPSATAYVVYPPVDSGPHYLADTIFHRAVYGYGPAPGNTPEEETCHYGIRQGHLSDGSGAHLLNFQPEAQRHQLDSGPVIGTLNSNQGLDLTQDYLPPLHPTARESAFCESHRYLLLVSRIVTDAGSGNRVPQPLFLYRMKQDEGRLQAQPFHIKDEIRDVNLQNGVMAHLLEVRTHRRVVEGEWRFDDPTGGGVNHDLQDFFRHLLPTTTGNREADEDIWRDGPLDLVEAAGVIERVMGPYRLEIEQS